MIKYNGFEILEVTPNAMINDFGSEPKMINGKYVNAYRIYQDGDFQGASHNDCLCLETCYSIKDAMAWCDAKNNSDYEALEAEMEKIDHKYMGD